MPIFKLILSILKRNWKSLLAMVTIGAAGIALMVGLMSSYQSLNNNITNYINNYQLQDITIETDINLISRLNLDELKTVNGISKIDTRIVYDVPLTINNRSTTSRIITVNENGFPKIKVSQQTSKDSNKVNVVMESSYANSLGAKLGDTIAIPIEQYTLNVYIYKIGSTPECLSLKRNKWIMGTSGSFGAIFIENSELSRYHLNLVYNQIIVRCKEGFSNQEVASSLKKVSNVTFNNVTLFEDSSVNEKINYNIHPLSSLSTIVPLVFFIISMMINVLFIYQMISRYKKEIGVTLTMGYSKKEIYKLFIFVCLLCAIGASALGIGIGYWLECFAYEKFIGAFNMSFTAATIDASTAILSVVITLIIFLLAGLFDTFRIVHYLTPIEAINNTTTNKTPTLKLKHLTPRIKVEVNRLFKNYKSVLISIFCISVSFVIIFAGLSFRNAKNLILDDLFVKRMNYDACAYLNRTISDEDLEELRQVSGVIQAERLIYAISEVEGENKSTSILIYGMNDANKDLVRILDDSHNITAFPDSGLTMDSTIADNLSIAVGDDVTINNQEVTVSKIARQDMLHVQYLNEDELLNIVDDSYYTSVLIKTTDSKALSSYYSSRSDLSLLKFTSEIKRSTSNSFNNSDVGIYIILAFGVIMGTVILFNMNLMSLEANKRNYAVRISIGFSLLNLSKELFIEDILRMIVSLLLGSALGRFFAIQTLNVMATANATYPYQDNDLVYLLTAGIVIAILLVTRLFSLLKIKRLNIAELIKDKE